MIYDVLKTLSIPSVYSHFRKPTKPPYIVYLGAGQNTFSADDTFTWRENTYQLEYYFTEKNETLEAEIENALLESGYRYQKSEDVYIDDEDVFVIYYQNVNQ